MAEFDHKVAFITGAAHGQGRATALALGREGARISAFDVAQPLSYPGYGMGSRGELDSLAEACRELGTECLTFTGDVRDDIAIAAAVDSTVTRFGRIDILFNNAGFGALDWFEELDPQRHIETLIRVNLIGTMLVTRAVLPEMLEQGSGHIINMASVAGLIAAPLLTTYSASKYGLCAFTDSLRREISPFGIRVSGIYPGPATTEFGTHLKTHPTRETINRFAFLRMSSTYVARRVVDLAKRPRRSLVIPWWFKIITTFDTLFPIVVDWILYLFAKKTHTLD